jgi:aminoglycoside 3-N-acetyltransferase
MNRKVYLHSREGDITDDYIADKLTSLGVSEGDTIMVSCRLPFIGRLAIGTTFVDLAKAVIENIYTLIGEKGTMVVPAYSYSFCRSEDFDPSHTPSTLGIFFETFRHQYARGRTLDPIFSICARGKNADFLLNGPDDDCFGPNSFFSRFHGLPESKFLLLGLNYHYITNFHFVEQMNRISYRYIKEFPGKIVMPDGQSTHRIQKYFVRDLSIKYEFSGFYNYIEENKLGRVAAFGNSEIKVIDDKRFVQAVTDLLRKNETYFLKVR